MHFLNRNKANNKANNKLAKLNYRYVYVTRSMKIIDI